MENKIKKQLLISSFVWPSSCSGVTAGCVKSKLFGSVGVYLLLWYRQTNSSVSCNFTRLDLMFNMRCKTRRKPL